MEHPAGRFLLVIPPRGGKTPTVSKLVSVVVLNHRLRALWITHREELLEQARKHLIACGIPEHLIGIIAAGVAPNPAAPVQVAMEGTLDNRHAPVAHIVCSDEAQHDGAPRRRRLRELYPNAFHLGFTGTPCRLGGNGLGQAYDEMYIAVQPSELIHDGYLTVPTVYAPEDSALPNMARLRRVGGDFELTTLGAMMNQPAMIQNIVDEWVRLADGRRTIAFPVNIDHSKEIVKRFAAAGVPAAHLDGNTKTTHRAQILDDLRAGRLMVVSSYGVLSEGVDLPEVKAIILARPTLSLALFVQQSARCWTPWDGHDVMPRIFDHANNTYRHGLPYADRAWDLRQDKRSHVPTGEAKVKRCPACGALAPLYAWKCMAPGCGASFRATQEAPTVVPGALRPIGMSPQAVEAERRRLATFAAGHGYPAAWADEVLAVKLKALAVSC